MNDRLNKLRTTEILSINFKYKNNLRWFNIKI